MKKVVGPELGTELGRRIKAMREARELTQRQVALMLGKAIESISNAETGRHLISLLTLQRLGEIFEVPMKSFFDDMAAPEAGQVPRSKYAATIINSVKILPEEDLEIVAGLIVVLEGRIGRRKDKDPANPPECPTELATTVDSPVDRPDKNKKVHRGPKLQKVRNQRERIRHIKIKDD